MRPDLLDILRCPFCGGPLAPLGAPVLDGGGRIRHAVLSCACCAYPVVDGIPVLRTSHAATQAIKDLEAGDHWRAMATLLDVDREERRAAFVALLEDAAPVTFEAALDALLPDGEGLYYLLRFSDPTFVVARAVAGALAQDAECFARRAVDVCGGCGHLARVLHDLSARHGGPPALLLDGSFWRLWLARHIVTADADVICCDANGPLPIVAGACSLAFCSDAFHYVWSKRLLADELSRLVGDAGVVVLTHVHSATGQNATAGLALEPEHYRSLFPGRTAAIFGDRALLAQVNDGRAVNLGAEATARALASEDSVTLVASRRGELFRPHHVVVPRLRARRLHVNPLYRATRTGDDVTLVRQFPTPEYEAEFGHAASYLPAEITLPAGLLDEPERLLAERPDLVERMVILDLPTGYLQRDRG